MAGSEPNARQKVIGVMVESDAGPHIQLQVRSNEIDRSSPTFAERDLWNSRQRGRAVWHATRALFETLCF
jgi:hypothetical protein